MANHGSSRPVRGQSSIAKKSEPWLVASMKRSLGRTKPKCQCKHHQKKLMQQQQQMTITNKDDELVIEVEDDKQLDSSKRTLSNTHQQIKALKKLYGKWIKHT